MVVGVGGGWWWCGGGGWWLGLVVVVVVGGGGWWWGLLVGVGGGGGGGGWWLVVGGGRWWGSVVMVVVVGGLRQPSGLLRGVESRWVPARAPLRTPLGGLRTRCSLSVGFQDRPTWNHPTGLVPNRPKVGPLRKQVGRLPSRLRAALGSPPGRVRPPKKGGGGGGRAAAAEWSDAWRREPSNGKQKQRIPERSPLVDPTPASCTLVDPT